MFRRLLSRRRTALLAATALVAAGLTTITALPAFAAVSCQVDYTLRSVWPTGLTADLTIHNNGDALNGWTLTYTWPGNQQVTNAWNATESSRLPVSAPWPACQARHSPCVTALSRSAAAAWPRP